MPDFTDPLVQSFVATFLAIALLFRLFLFHPGQRFPKILSALRKGPKTFDEIREVVPNDPRSLNMLLEFMEFRLLYIVRRWRSPWDKQGTKQDPWVYDITPIGIRVLDNPDRTPQDRD